MKSLLYVRIAMHFPYIMSFNHVFLCEVSPFTPGKTDAQRAKVLCPRLHLQGGGAGILIQVIGFSEP